MDESSKKLHEDIPGTYLDRFERVSKDAWKHEDFRKRIIGICDEHQGTQDFVKKIEIILIDFLGKEIFIKKVKEISKEEIVIYIDKSRIKTIFWVFGLVITGIITAIIGILLQKSGKLF